MKKWFLRIGLGILALLVLLYSFLMVRSKIPATVHDQELQLVRADIPQGSNAFDMLQKAGSHVWWPTNQDCEIFDLAKNTNWDAALAGTVIASNCVALAGWDAALKLPDFQIPEASKFDDRILMDWSALRKLAFVAEVRENFLFRNGHDQEAFDQIMNHVQIGRWIQNAHGVLIDYLIGVAMAGIGLDQMRNWTGKVHLEPAQLKDYIRLLDLKPDDKSAAFANTIKAEYQFQATMIDMTCNGKMTNSFTGGYYPRVSPWWPVFNFSQTRALFAQGALKLVKAAARHYNEANVAELESRPSVASMYLSGNGVGQILYYMTVPAVAASLATKAKGDVQLQATRTILALRAYQLTHGQLPKDLSALVPEFLEAVPVDDFDGQPLRYSAEKKMVYSVGKNLKDDGGDDRGSDAPATQRHLDLAFKFDF